MADLGDRIHRHFIDVSISEKKAGGIFPTLYLHNIPARHISHQSSGVLLLVYSAAWSQRSRSHSHARCCGVFRKVYPQRLLAPTSCALFALLCYAAYGRTRDLTQSRREWQQGIAGDYRAFVRGLQSIPAPPPGETLFFRSYPQYFDRGVLLFATQIALRRTDIGAQLVDTFPPDARYRLRFEASRIIAEE